MRLRPNQFLTDTMVKFDPLNLPIQLRLQTFGVAWYVFSFMALAQCCLGLFFYLTFYTRLWPFMLAYSVFYVYDIKTPERGGRPIQSIKDWRVWRWMFDYFPIFTHKTVELDPERSYILSCHPHGVLCPSTFASLLVGKRGIMQAYPNFQSRLSMLNFWFYVPFFREYIMAGGLTKVTKEALNYMLKNFKKGTLIAILPGGASEALDARPGDVHILLRNKYGFLKLAMVHGTPLVPCFAFGDHECWDQDENPPGSKLRNFQEKLLDIFTMSLPMFHARGIFQTTWGFIPYRRPLHFYVGKPIEVKKNENPSREELEKLRILYQEKLQELFEEHKGKYLAPGTQLIIH